MRVVQGNWAAVVKELRNVIAENVTMPKGYNEHFLFELRETDSFHPFDNSAERMMSRALRDMPVRCDYRNCESLAYWKNAKEEMLNAIYAWLDETQEIIVEYYSNPWNFGPGYVRLAEDSMTFPDWGKVSTKVFARIHRAALSK